MSMKDKFVNLRRLARGLLRDEKPGDNDGRQLTGSLLPATFLNSSSLYFSCRPDSRAPGNQGQRGKLSRDKPPQEICQTLRGADAPRFY